jgi:hypothetical protein
MKKPKTFALLFLLTGMLAEKAVSQDTVPPKDYWTQGTAFTLPKTRIELAILSASRIGLTDRVELSAHPLMFFLLPQAFVKCW